ncbi:MAG: hypothetical protein HUU55_17220 [Myxococcales bacterium]|nr:hypothetical protein [Myxococcales bacterium]
MKILRSMMVPGTVMTRTLGWFVLLILLTLPGGCSENRCPPGQVAIGIEADGRTPICSPWSELPGFCQSCSDAHVVAEDSGGSTGDAGSDVPQRPAGSDAHVVAEDNDSSAGDAGGETPQRAAVLDPCRGKAVWVEQPITNPSGIDASWLMDVQVFSPVQAVAVGWDGTIATWDGKTWELSSTGTGDDLEGVWGTSSTALWAVSWFSTILSFGPDGWATSAANTLNPMYDIRGTSGTSIWAVGLNATILRFDGTVWSFLPASPKVNPLLDWVAVWPLDETHVWVAGWEHDVGSVIALWDGQSLSPKLEQGPGGYEWWTSLWAADADAEYIFAAAASGAVYRSDSAGDTWAPMVSATKSRIWDIWGADADLVWAGTESGEITLWDGHKWSLDGNVGEWISAIAGAGPELVIAVGGRWEDATSGYVPLIWRRVCSEPGE